VEVIVLTILRDAGIISAYVFSALIIMAVISTALSMRLTQLMLAQEQWPSTGEPAPSSRRGCLMGRLGVCYFKRARPGGFGWAGVHAIQPKAQLSLRSGQRFARCCQSGELPA